ncbi:hypothetical protein [Pararhodobacter sp.]|uniref:hypothetical protein n=1 Tax=Pararhodobacter sp. TaxID=2127056 RepID=UPI002FDD7853
MQSHETQSARHKGHANPEHERVEQGSYALLVETADQGPVLLETSGEASSYDAAVSRGALFEGAVRWAVVEMKPVYGNKLLFMDFERMQRSAVQDDQS